MACLNMLVAILDKGRSHNFQELLFFFVLIFLKLSAYFKIFQVSFSKFSPQSLSVRYFFLGAWLNNNIEDAVFQYLIN
jgi:hypothetical protein